MQYNVLKSCFQSHFLVSVLLSLVTTTSYASDDSYREAIRERIAPVGRVTIEPTAPSSLVPVKPKKPVSAGEKIYKSYCIACHAAGVAGAPKKGNTNDWQARQLHGVAGLVKSAIKGIAPSMPAKGTCADCTEAQIEAAIRYMLPKSGK